MATTVAPTEKKLPQVQEKVDRKQRPRLDDKLKVFSGTANQPLADEVCEFLGLSRGQAFLTRLKDVEHYVQIREIVSIDVMYVYNPTCFPLDEHIMELIRLINALNLTLQGSYT